MSNKKPEIVLLKNLDSIPYKEDYYSEIIKPEDTTGKFRVSAKNLFLTYPRADLDVKEVLKQLKYKLINQCIKDYCISKESHTDGTFHIHVYISLHKGVNTSNPKHFDLKDSDLKAIHGRYQTAKKTSAVIEYILKSFSGKDGKDNPNLIYSKNISIRIDAWGAYLPLGESMISLAKEGNIDKALELYEKNRPLDYLKNHKALEKSLKALHWKETGFKSKFNYKDFIIPEGLKQILDNYDRTKSLVLIGNPGTGKTQMVMAFLKDVLQLKPMIINNVDAIRFHDSRYNDAIIFDDCNWDPNIPREELIKLLDSEVSTTHNIKHGTIRIEKPTPRVIIGNEIEPWFNNSKLKGDKDPYQDGAVKRRMILFKFDQTLIPNKPNNPF